MRTTILLLLLSCLVACKAREGQTCKDVAECEDGLMCLDGVCLGEEGANTRCQELCAKSMDGTCSARDGKCVIATDNDCAGSQGCRETGQCSFRGGGCCVGGGDRRGGWGRSAVGIVATA